jgi:diguanylate cyclase (GGDEF)-like protein
MVGEATKKPLLIAVVAALLAVAFVATAVLSFAVSKREMREQIVSEELPLTTDTIYSAIQRDLIQPVNVSSTMANNSFFRDWVLAGETDVDQVTKFLKEVQKKYAVFGTFFVSERTRIYYTPTGILKKVSDSDWRDVWYFRVRQMAPEYEINVDPDEANKDAITIFINFCVFDYAHNFIGSTGVGLTLSSVRELIDRYQRNFGRRVYFVDSKGHVVVSDDDRFQGKELRAIEGMGGIASAVLKGDGGAFDYVSGGETRLLNVRFIRELNWYVFVEKGEERALAGIRRTLYANLAIALTVTCVVVLLLTLTLNRYQRRLEQMATTDKLTGLANRQTYEILVAQAVREARRTFAPLSLVMLDIDRFKMVNDRYGHLVGDEVIKAVAVRGLIGLRRSDIACRWGGEEFLLLLRNCDLVQAVNLADTLRVELAAVSLDDIVSDLRITVSLGVAQLARDEDETSLFARTDRALYEAKHKGRNRVVAA